LSTWQLATPTTMMNMNPLMVVVPTNVLHIQLLKYHDNDDLVILIRQLTKVVWLIEKIQMIINYNIF
jgi:hypothetical protein